MIARARLTHHLFIDATFHHPIGYQQLLIIIFKDIVTSEYFPCFYILMSNKTEILYHLIFKSIIRILTQNDIYTLEIKTITTDTETALINAVTTTFINTQRIGCWFHLKQELLREARILGLLNKKNKKINIDITYEVITQLALLPLEYKGDMNYLTNQLEILSNQYPLYNNFIKGIFTERKLNYFKDESYNYQKFPKDIRSNSILERYNKTIKIELGQKRTCNWVVFLNFINKEITRINQILAKNENINILYKSKYTKFGIEKYAPQTQEDKNKSKTAYQIKEISNETIADCWLKQKGNNCRYNAFITLFYSSISPFLTTLKDRNLIQLNELNKLITKLAENINYKNYCDIIIFLQKNKFDSNNEKIDEIIKEEDEKKKEELIKKLKFDDTTDFTSSGYAAQLFSIFNNNIYFCLRENKESECIICGNKKTEEITNMQPFVFINGNNINNASIFNLFLEKYKEIYSYACECRKDNNEDVLCLRVKYNILSYPVFLFLLFDFQYSELTNYKDKIYKLLKDKITLNFRTEYRLIGIIGAPKINHYNAIIFNPMGPSINKKFTPNNIYYHDGMLNNGCIISLKKGEDWKSIGIIIYLYIIKLKNKCCGFY